MEDFEPFIEWLKTKDGDSPAINDESFNELFMQFIIDSSNSRLIKLKNEIPFIINENKVNNDVFFDKHIFYWKPAMDLLELLISTCIKAGSNVNTEREILEDSREEIHIGVLIRLHAKACAISNEILLLLKNGFADGAHARWRTLHEINVTLHFLDLNGSECTERFLAHEIYDSYYGMKFHKKYENRLQEKGPSEEECKIIKNEFKCAIAKYGHEFDSQYGWAVPYIKTDNPSRVGFQSLERAVRLDHMRPYFKWASQNVHTSFKTLTKSLAAPSFDINVINVGPSNYGLTDPAHAAALSLSQSTCAILKTSTTHENLIMMKCISNLCTEIGNAFLHISHQFER